MHAAVVTRFGDPDVFELTELPDPVPGPGQVAIEVSHAAVGLIDVYLRQGLYRERPGLPQPPYVPGLEVAGTVRSVGAGVDRFRVGEPVVTLSGTGADGGYAAVAVVDAAVTVSLDGTGISADLAVAALPNAATAWLALSDIAHFVSGERLLVNGALGGLAATFPGVAKMLGASTIVGTVRRGSLAAAQASGLPYDEIVVGDELVKVVGERRFDVVVDPVGGRLRTDSLQVMAPMGRMLLVGNASGDWQHTVETNALWGASVEMLGFSIGTYLPANLHRARPAAEAALRAIQAGLVGMRTETLPLSKAAEAHRRVETGSLGGRILLTP